jgi:calcineurin-like phosphoesterase family protein
MKTFFIADHHFHHANILSFRDKEGELIRPGFTDVTHMNEYMVEKWNDVVGKNDRVYVGGDVIMRTSVKYFDILERLNGRKILIKGNHDNAKLNTYAKYFSDIRSENHFHTPDKQHMIILTHRPIILHENRSLFNVHGHTHDFCLNSPRYINISVEQIDYTPVEWNVLVQMVYDRFQTIEEGETRWK